MWQKERRSTAPFGNYFVFYHFFFTLNNRLRWGLAIFFQSCLLSLKMAALPEASQISQMKNSQKNRLGLSNSQFGLSFARGLDRGSLSISPEFDEYLSWGAPGSRPFDDFGLLVRRTKCFMKTYKSKYVENLISIRNIFQRPISGTIPPIM